MNDAKKTKAQLIQELALLRQQLTARAANDAHYQNLFEDMPLSLWEEDLSAVKVLIDAQRERGVTDFAAYFATQPDFARQCVERIKIVNVNQATLDMAGAANKTDQGANHCRANARREIGGATQQFDESGRSDRRASVRNRLEG